MNIPKYTVIQYIRNKKNIPCGVLVAVKQNNKYNIGYSLCNKRDRFSKQMALKIAIGRAMENNSCNFPHPVVKLLGSFKDRCNKYYKDCV